MGTSSSIQATRVQNQQEASELSEATHTWSETASFDAALVRQATAKLLETVLKNDHFEAIQKLPEVIAGAPNFRRSKASSASPIFGTGQPTTEGFLDLINWCVRTVALPPAVPLTTTPLPFPQARQQGLQEDLLDVPAAGAGGVRERGAVHAAGVQRDE